MRVEPYCWFTHSSFPDLISVPPFSMAHLRRTSARYKVSSTTHCEFLKNYTRGIVSLLPWRNENGSLWLTASDWSSPPCAMQYCPQGNQRHYFCSSISTQPSRRLQCLLVGLMTLCSSSNLAPTQNVVIEHSGWQSQQCGIIYLCRRAVYPHVLCSRRNYIHSSLQPLNPLLLLLCIHCVLHMFCFLYALSWSSRICAMFVIIINNLTLD